MISAASFPRMRGIARRADLAGAFDRFEIEPAASDELAQPEKSRDFRDRARSRTLPLGFRRIESD
jgi:hypothetical protein